MSEDDTPDGLRDRLTDRDEIRARTVRLPFGCPWCERDAVSHNGVVDGFVCAECGRRWTETTATERAFRLAEFDDEIAVDGLGTLTVTYVSSEGDKIGGEVDDDGGSAEIRQLFRREDGRAELDDGTVVTVSHPEDAWAEAATAEEAVAAGWERPGVERVQDEYGDVVTVTAGTVLHDALENRVLEVREELGMGVRADPRDGGEPVEIPEYGGLRGERYAVLAP